MDIAKSLADLPENNLVKAALDRSNDLDNIVDQVFSKFWTPDLTSRKPNFEINYKDGRPFKITSLDLLPLLLNFSIRSAVINLKSYDNLRPSVKKSGERVISKENRHGNVLQVNANKETHAFSILIKDFNVVQELGNGFERVGAPRRFNVLDDAGNWYSDFAGLDFIANLTKKEEDLLGKFDENVHFKYFVHPSRAMSIYSSGYLITKFIEERRADEAKFYNNLIKKLENKDISLPEEEKDLRWKYYFKKNKKRGGFIPKKICMKKSDVVEKEIGDKDYAAVLLAELQHPEFYGEYKIYGLDSFGNPPLSFDHFSPDNLPGNKNALRDILRYCKARYNYPTHNIGTQLRTGTRAVELAFLKYGTDLETIQWGYEDNNPGWDVPVWQDIKIKNTNYRMLDFGNGFRLLYRLKVKESKVADSDKKEFDKGLFKEI